MNNQYGNLCRDGKLPNDDIMNMIIVAFDNGNTPAANDARCKLDALGINMWDAVDAMRLYRQKKGK